MKQFLKTPSYHLAFGMRRSYSKPIGDGARSLLITLNRLASPLEFSTPRHREPKPSEFYKNSGRAPHFLIG
jgi:hypothetical protein